MRPLLRKPNGERAPSAADFHHRHAGFEPKFCRGAGKFCRLRFFQRVVGRAVEAAAVI